MMQDDNSTTLTHRFAAIQIKMWHIQLRMRQIFENQKILNEREYKTNRDRIKGFGPAIYSVVDMLVTFEHLEGLMTDVLATKEIREELSDVDRGLIGSTKNLTARWKAVRNVFGGHIDIKMVENVCVEHNFRGALLSDDLETDMAVYNCLLLEGAINEARKKSDLFGRNLVFKNDLAGELKLVVDKLNSDWNEAFKYFKPLMERIYEIGKFEKAAVTPLEQRKGIVTGN